MTEYAVSAGEFTMQRVVKWIDIPQMDIPVYIDVGMKGAITRLDIPGVIKSTTRSSAPVSTSPRGSTRSSIPGVIKSTTQSSAPVSTSPRGSTRLDTQGVTSQQEASIVNDYDVLKGVDEKINFTHTPQLHLFPRNAQPIGYMMVGDALEGFLKYIQFRFIMSRAMLLVDTYKRKIESEDGNYIVYVPVSGFEQVEVMGTLLVSGRLSIAIIDSRMRDIEWLLRQIPVALLVLNDIGSIVVCVRPGYSWLYNLAWLIGSSFKRLNVEIGGDGDIYVIGMGIRTGRVSLMVHTINRMLRDGYADSGDADPPGVVRDVVDDVTRRSHEI